jgi:hypothetical protein
MEERAENMEAVPINDVRQALQSTGRRLALIHLEYAKAIVEELGEERGIRVIARAIKNYGSKIGAKTREEVLAKGLEAIPENFGQGETYRVPNIPGAMHDTREIIEVDGGKGVHSTGCLCAKVWKEEGEEKLGRLYCYMDVAKYMAFNPDYKYVHIKAIPDGDDCCEMGIKPTTEQEREDFFSKDKDWFYIDQY